MFNLKKLFFLFAMLLTVAANLVAQGVSATVTGVIVDDQNLEVIGATVMVKNESTGFTAGAVTNVMGEYTIKQLPLGSPYSVTVTYIGYAEQVKRGFSLNQGDVVRVNFKLSESSQELNEVVVTAESFQAKTDVLGAATSITQKDIATLPVNGRNFTALTSLSPLSSGQQIAGQLSSSTAYSIDGMTASGPLCGNTTNRGPYLVSMEAIREFEVVTNSYDVTRGRAGGGTISSVSKSGTNELHGSAFTYHRSDYLSSPYLANGNTNNNKYSQTQFGFSLGGPIIKDRAHFFVAVDQQIDSRPLLIADIRTENDAKNYNVTKETVDEFVKIAQDQYGVDDSQQVGAFDKVRPSTSVFARVDWQLDAQNLLTIRNNYNRDMNNHGVGDNHSKICLYETYGSHLSSDNSLLATLRSVLSPSTTNELKAQYLHTMDDGRPSDQLPSTNIPKAVVENIKSDLNGETLTLQSMQLGGQRYLPETFINDVAQVVNNVYYTTDRVSYTFGADVMFTHLYSLATSEMNGRFYYDGMEAFKNNTPYRYAREVATGDPAVTQDVLNGALYAQADIDLAAGLDLSAGVRGDYTYYFSNPTENAVLKSELGLSTTNKVKAFQFQPRAQLTWDINDKHTDVIKIGGGIFGSNMNNYAMVNNLQFDGNRVYSLDIRGDQIPTPNFPAYREDPTSAPGLGLFDQLGLEKVATYNVNAEDVKIPTVYKYSLSYNKFFNSRLRAGASFYGTHARNNYMYIDRNMVDDPYFTLENEGGRGVYVPANTITAKGQTDWTQGKKSDKVGRVLELVSEGEINTYTFVVDASYRYYKDGQVTASYTLNDTKDNTSYNGNVANSATLYRQITDDPRDMATMAYADGQFRHKLVVYGNAPSFYGVNVGLRYTGMGGSRYSAVVGGNINGDFVNGNDLAFVFDPSDPKTPDHIKQGMNDLLNNPKTTESFKSYLKNNFGKVAERNGGENAFSGTFDIKISKDFKTYKTQSLQLSLDLFNVANMMNKEWGLTENLGRQTLLNVTGFDQAKKEYTYSVNQNAGRSYFGGSPWQIQLGVKYAF